MNLFKSFDSGNGQNSQKAARPSSGMDSSNPCHWKSWRLHHHGDGVYYLFVLFVLFLTRDLSVGLVVPTF
jgi:hypothetical protein